MKASELRVGNIVSYEGSPILVADIAIDHEFSGEWCVGGYALSSVEPIPLTPEILENAGFERENFELRLVNGVCYVDHKGNTITAINYVHELQNLYFALTGEELQIEL